LEIIDLGFLLVGLSLDLLNSPSTDETGGKIAGAQAVDPHAAFTQGSVNELVVADVYSHVGGTAGLAMLEKNEVSQPQGIPGNLEAQSELLPRRAGKVDTQDLENFLDEG
jgi:hypothetical protein